MKVDENASNFRTIHLAMPRSLRQWYVLIISRHVFMFSVAVAYIQNFGSFCALSMNPSADKIIH